MTSGGAPTPPGQRVGALKYQVPVPGQRGQPVYRNPATGLWALATSDTGFDGVIGSIRSTNQFEVVSAGELDGLTNLPLTPSGTLYLTGSPGVLSPRGTIPVLRLSAPDKAVVVGAAAASAASASAPGLSQTFSVPGAAGAAPLGTPAGVLDMSWLNLSALVTDVLAAIPAAPIDDRNVRAPEFGGVLDIDPAIGGSLVFDIDSVTQVIDSAFPL